MDEVNGVVRGTVQDAFRLTNNCQTLQSNEPRPANSEAGTPSQLDGGAISPEELSAVLTAHSGDGMASLSGVSPPLPQLPEEDPSAVIPESPVESSGARCYNKQSPVLYAAA